MHTDKRGYGYETYREGGRVCRRYIGRGAWVNAAIYLNRLDRERDDDRQRQRAPLESMRASEAALNAYCGALDSLVSDAMHAGGYHRHKRGDWRKRRYSAPQTQNQTQNQTDMATKNTIAIPAQAGTDTAKDKAELRKAQKDPVAARAWLDTVKGTPRELELLDILAPVAQNASTHLIKHLAGDNELVKEAYRRQLERTVREIGGPNPTALETQLAQRVAVCELSVVALERLHSGCIGKSLDVWEAVGRQLDAAHRRYIGAVKALASIRKAQLPDVQINVAEKQVNINAR